MDYKKIIKIFIIIGMVCGCFAICPIIIGFMALDKLDKAKNKEELTVMAILTLIFVSPVAGLIMILADEKELFIEEDIELVEVDSFDSIYEDNANKLRELKSLYEDGFITEEEYQEKRKKYINSL